MDPQGHKTDKELAVYLTGEYLKAIYSGKNMAALTSESAKSNLRMWYDAIKSIPDGQ